MKRLLNLNISPQWDEIEKVRNEAGSFFEFQGFSNDTAQALVMVMSELVENSIKYGNFEQTENTVKIYISLIEDTVTIEVTNPVAEKTKENLKNLDKTIQWIRGYQDSFEAYIEKLKEISRKPFSDEESGLGLVRIAYEGKAILDFFVDEDDLLNVSAVSYVDETSGATYGEDRSIHERSLEHSSD